MENKIISKLRKTSISKRLIVSFLTLSIVPIILIFLVVNTTTINLIKNNIVNNDKVASKLICDSIGSYISKFDTITNEIIWDSELLNSIRNYNKLSTEEKNKFNNELARILRSRTTYTSDIADFTIFNEELNVVSNEGFNYISQDTKIQEIKKGLSANKIINWTSIRQENSNYVAITKPINMGNRNYGYIFLAIKEKVILNMFKNYNNNFNGFGFISDEHRNIVLSNNKDLTEYDEIIKESSLSNYTKSKDIKVLEQIDNSTRVIKYKSKKFIITEKPISYATWKLVGVIPYNYIYLSCIDIYKTYAIVSVIVIGLSILIAMIIHRSIANPINEIVHAMNNINENTLGKSMVVSGSDEISFIMKRYNKMTKNIKTLIHTVKLREKEKREVTLRMLQAQINPHFLFNTLGSLRYVAMMNNDKVVSNGLEALAKLLRSTIVNKNEFISIKEEIENVKNYITIQKIRYGDTFGIEYELENIVLEQKILKFILQPIVENCILHGFEETDECNNIKIKIYDNEEFLNFEIIDNGVGITEDKLEEGSFNIDKFAGIGVKNIRERLNLYYEGVFTFEIISNKQNGTVSKIIIPKIIGGAVNESISS